MAGAPGIGLNSSVAIGRESTWATLVAATKKFRLRGSPSFKADVDYVERGAMYGQSVRPAPVVGVSVGRARLSFDLCYEGFLPWLDTAMGTNSFGSDGASTSGGPSYTHGMGNKTLFNSLSMEFSRGNIPSTKCETLRGMKIRELSIYGDGGQGGSQLVGLDVDLVGERHATDATPTSLASFAGTTNVLFKHATFKDGTGETTTAGLVTGFRFTLRNKLAERWGPSQYIAEPVIEDYCEAELMLRTEFATNTAFEAYLAGTVSAASADNPQVLLSNGSQSIKLEVVEGYLLPFEPNGGGRGIITQECTWKAIRPSSSMMSTPFAAGTPLTQVRNQGPRHSITYRFHSPGLKAFRAASLSLRSKSQPRRPSS